MGFQTTTAVDPDKWVEGMVPEEGPWIVRNYRNAEDTAIQPGEAVRAQGTLGVSCQSCAETDLTAQTFLGVAVSDRTMRPGGYANGDMVPVMMFGPVVIRANETIDASTSTDGAIINTVSDGASWGDDQTDLTLGLGAAGNERPLAAYRANIANNALGILEVRTYGETPY